MTDKPKLGDGKYKDGNPKTALGIAKPSTFYTPTIPYLLYSMVHMQGAFKYGTFNWRDDPVSISTYLDAAKRHIDLYRDGQQAASDTQLHNLAHAMTCLSILIDAEYHNTLIDDRWKPRIPRPSYNVEDAFMNTQKDIIKKIYDDWYGFAERQTAKDIKEPIPEQILTKEEYLDQFGHLSGYTRSFISDPGKAKGLRGIATINNWTSWGTIEGYIDDNWIVRFNCAAAVLVKIPFTNFEIDSGR